MWFVARDGLLEGAAPLWSYHWAFYRTEWLDTVGSMNLGSKSKLMRSLFARTRYAVESYVESSVESRCKRRSEYVEVVPLFWYSTGLRALFRDDQVVMQPTMITSFSSFFPFFFFSFWPQAPFPNYPFHFLSQAILTDTSVPPLHIFAYKKEPSHHHCVHRLFTGYEPSTFDINIDRHQATSH